MEEPSVDISFGGSRIYKQVRAQAPKKSQARSKKTGYKNKAYRPLTEIEKYERQERMDPKRYREKRPEENAGVPYRSPGSKKNPYYAPDRNRPMTAKQRNYLAHLCGDGPTGWRAVAADVLKIPAESVVLSKITVTQAGKVIDYVLNLKKQDEENTQRYLDVL